MYCFRGRHIPKGEEGVTPQSSLVLIPKNSMQLASTLEGENVDANSVVNCAQTKVVPGWVDLLESFGVGVTIALKGMPCPKPYSKIC